ncbi:hypothetical protein JCM37173_32460 [Allocoprococcus similis]
MLKIGKGQQCDEEEYEKAFCYQTYSTLYRILPRGYRVWASSAELYDAMIYVSDAHPIEVIED